MTNKELRTYSKPWMTPALIKSIRIKNRTQKQFRKVRNPKLKEDLHKAFKNYRNHIFTLTQISKKKITIKSSLIMIKKNKKKLWIEIRSIINVKAPKSSRKSNLNICEKVITGESSIANHFNNLFTLITKK